MEIIFLLLVLFAIGFWIGAFWYGYQAKMLKTVVFSLLKNLGVITVLVVLSNGGWFYWNRRASSDAVPAATNAQGFYERFFDELLTGAGDVILFLLFFFVVVFVSSLILLVSGFRAYRKAKAKSVPAAAYDDVLDDW